MGWGGEEQKKYSRKGKLNEKKNYARQLILKKYSGYGLKKIHIRNLITKKIFENSPPPHNFSNGPSLITHSSMCPSTKP